MNVVLKPSLEQRALVKVAVSLWNQNDVGALIALVNVKNERIMYPTDEEWKEIEARVLKRVAQLPLPQLLNEKVSGFIQAIGLEIYEWIDLYCRRYNLHVNLPSELCWTPQGTVDRKRTAVVLVKEESLDLSTRYVLACVCCLEDDIIALWNTLSEDLKQSSLSRDSPINRDWHKEWIIRFWSRTMKGRRLRSYKYGFKQCARSCNKAAVEYFLQKLTPREREASLVEAAKCVADAEVLCLLLSQMDEQQQMEVFKDAPVRVLQCSLQWPLQSFFMEIANCMWDFLPKMDYEYILRNIIYKVRNGYKDCNYHKLFKEFWQKSPHALKSLIADEMGESDLLPALCPIKDKEIIRLILQDATHTARKDLFYSDRMNDFFQDCIRDDEWDFLEFCIRECFPSKDLMLKFKESFEKYEKRDDIEDIFVRKKHKWDKLFLLSDDSLREYEKRSADEGESSSSK